MGWDELGIHDTGQSTEAGEVSTGGRCAVPRYLPGKCTSQPTVEVTVTQGDMIYLRLPNLVLGCQGNLDNSNMNSS